MHISFRRALSHKDSLMALLQQYTHNQSWIVQLYYITLISNSQVSHKMNIGGITNSLNFILFVLFLNIRSPQITKYLFHFSFINVNRESIISISSKYNIKNSYFFIFIMLMVQAMVKLNSYGDRIF